MISITPSFLTGIVGQSLVLDIVIFIISIALLMWSAGMLVISLEKIGFYFKLSGYVIAFILMGLITSVPELFVGISSAMNNVSIYSLGNVIGSNIANIGLVLGLAIILVKTFHVKKEVSKEDSIYMLIVAVLPLILLADGFISRSDGVVLLGVFTLYMTRLLFQRKETNNIKREKIKGKQFFVHVVTFLFAMYILFLASNILVETGVSVSKRANMPLILIGLFATAIGTSIPEIAFTIKSAKNFGEMTLGNLIGSVIINSTLVLGVTAIISPIYLANALIVSVSAIFMVLYLFLFLIFSRTHEKFTLTEGFVFIFLYLVFAFITYSLR